MGVRRPWFGGKKARQDGQLAVYSVPGIWMVMPSSKGWVKFLPYFLSRKELLKAWVRLFFFFNSTNVIP